MNTTALTPVDFHGATLLTTTVDGVPYVAMKPIAEALGLQWESQYNRLNRDEVLKTCISIMNIQMPGDDQTREVLFLQLDMLNGWLFGVHISRTKPEIRPILLQYKRECYKVLSRHFRPELKPSQPITPKQRQNLRELVRLIVASGKQTYGETWARFQNKFCVNSYMELPADKYDEAYQYLSGKFDGESVHSLLLLVDKHLASRQLALPMFDLDS